MTATEIVEAEGCRAVAIAGELLDYSASKGMSAAFTWALSENLVGEGIHVNAVAPSFLFLACEDSRYMSGQVLHPNGGTIVGNWTLWPAHNIVARRKGV